jgi:hypothetical protein
MGRPPLNGTQAMTATERQQRWRRRCRERVQAARLKGKARVIKPEAHPADTPDNGYTAVIRQVLEFVDARPQSQVHLFRLIMRLQSAYQRRQQAAVETDAASPNPRSDSTSREAEIPALHRSGDTIDQTDIDLDATVELGRDILDE